MALSWALGGVLTWCDGPALTWFRNQAVVSGGSQNDSEGKGENCPGSSCYSQAKLLRNESWVPPRRAVTTETTVCWRNAGASGHGACKITDLTPP